MFKTGQKLYDNMTMTSVTCHDPGETITTIGYSYKGLYFVRQELNINLIDYNEYIKTNRDKKIESIVN